MADNDQKTPGIKVEKFRTAHSEPAGIVVLELANDQGASFQFAMTHSMVQQVVKSLQDQLSKSKSKMS